MIDNWFMTSVQHEGYLYWITEISGLIMRMNIDTGRAEYVKIDGVGDSKDLSGSAMIYIEGNIIFTVINRGQYLLMIDIERRKGKFIYLGLEKKYLNMCASVKKYEDELIVVPIYAPEIFRINVKTNKINGEIIASGKYINDGKLDMYYSKCEIEDDSNLWLFPCKTKKAIKYNIKTGQKKAYIYSEEVGNPLDVKKIGNNFIIVDQQSDIYSVDINNHEYRKIMECPEKGTLNVISLIHIANNRLWLLPGYGKNIYYADINSKKIKCLEKYPDTFSYEAPAEMSKYTYETTYKGKSYFSMHAGNMIFYVDDIQGEEHWVDVKWPKGEELLDYLTSRGKINIQEKEVSLRMYIDYLQKQ